MKIAIIYEPLNTDVQHLIAKAMRRGYRVVRVFREAQEGKAVMEHILAYSQRQRVDALFLPNGTRIANTQAHLLMLYRLHKWQISIYTELGETAISERDYALLQMLFPVANEPPIQEIIRLRKMGMSYAMIATTLQSRGFSISPNAVHNNYRAYYKAVAISEKF